MNGMKLMQTLGLIITENCNLNCNYCYMHHKNETLMEIATAKTAIACAFQEAAEKDTSLRIDFLGGEPLMEFSLIREICEWTWSQTLRVDYCFFATTNGTLLNEEMKKWFFANKSKFVLGLSYDGLFETQNKCRSNSCSLIDINFFISTWSFQPLKMTIAEEAARYLSKNIIYLHENRIPFNTSFALGVSDWKEKSVDIFGEEMKNLVEYYISNSEVTPSDLFDINLFEVYACEQETRRYCGAGKDYYVVDASGKRYPCHLFSPMALSAEKIKKSDSFDMWNRFDYAVENCKGCVLNPLCPICYGMSFRLFGNPFHREINICNLFKKQVLAVCVYYIKILTHKKKCSKDDIALAKTIEYILEATL